MDHVQGVVPMLVTPFDAHERMDEASLRCLVDYEIDAGVHGLGISFPGEIDKLTEAERTRLIEVVVDQIHERVPLVVNISAPGTTLAMAYARQAASLGAAAVMAMPPRPQLADDAVRAFYAAMAEAVSLPIVFQSSGDRIIRPRLMRDIAMEYPQARSAKVDPDPPLENLRAAVETCGDIVAILGGASGRFFIDELQSGARGTTPWPSRPHAFVRVWELWQAGDHEPAREVFQRQIEPLLSTSGLDHKEVLRREGVITSAQWRAPEPVAPSAEQRRRFDEVCVQLGIGQAGAAS